MDTESIQSLMNELRRSLAEGRGEEELLQALQPVFGKDSVTDEGIVESLGDIPDAKIPKVLRRLLDAAPPRNVRKRIKRSLYRLKAKGVAVEEGPAEIEESILRPVLPESPKGWAGIIDSRGDRFLLLTIPHRTGGVTVAEGLVSDTAGFVKFSGGEMTRKKVKELLDGVLKNTPFPVVEIDPSYAAFLFTEAHELTLRRKTAPPQDYLSVRAEIERVIRPHEKPLVYRLLDPEELAENDWALQRSGDLLKSEPFSAWTIEKDVIRPYVNEAREAQESKILLSDLQKKARLDEIFGRALAEIFPDEKRRLFKRRLEEMAYVLMKQNRDEDARWALAGAIDLERPMNPFKPNPFLYQLVVRSIGGMLSGEYESEKAVPSLIVKP